MMQNDKMGQLAMVESYLVEQLSLTQRNQQKALDNLHNVVQICNTQVNTSDSIDALQAARHYHDSSKKQLGEFSPTSSD